MYSLVHTITPCNLVDRESDLQPNLKFPEFGLVLTIHNKQQEIRVEIVTLHFLRNTRHQRRRNTREGKGLLSPKSERLRSNRCSRSRKFLFLKKLQVKLTQVQSMNFRWRVMYRWTDEQDVDEINHTHPPKEMVCGHTPTDRSRTVLCGNISSSSPSTNLQ